MRPIKLQPFIKTMTWVAWFLVMVLVVVTYTVESKSVLEMMLMETIVPVLQIALALIWPLYVVVIIEGRESKKTRNSLYLTLFMICTMFAIAYLSVFHGVDFNNTLASTILIPIFAAIFYIVYVTSVALTEAEERAFLSRKSSKTALFFCFGYFLIGMYFIDRRLRALSPD